MTDILKLETRNLKLETFMTVYFYHTQDSNYIYNEWKAGRFPSHLLYGACELPSEGIDVIIHPTIDQLHLPRWRKMILIAFDVIKHYRKLDAVYATKQNGLDLIILLRALGLFRKPIILWHHQPILPREGFFKRCLAKFYLSGIDHMFMFSDNIVKTSIKTGLVPASKLQQCLWGADIDYYDRLNKKHPTVREGFISTGKEQRDMPTLISAFTKCHDQNLHIITTAQSINLDYEEIFHGLSIPENVDIIINHTMWIPELAMKILPHKCICICCLETNYTVGLTTLIEALAFGMPVIISRNPNQPFDASEEGCGISLPYGDVDGWIKAIRFIADNPDKVKEIGHKAHELAEKKYNIRNSAHIVAEKIKEICTKEFKN